MSSLVSVSAAQNLPGPRESALLPSSKGVDDVHRQPGLRPGRGMCARLAPAPGPHTSLPSCLIRSASDAVVPGLEPASTSALQAQVRSTSG